MTEPGHYMIDAPRSDFCHVHAFYDCPICRGEDPAWVIPIQNSVTGEYTGEVTVRDSGEVTITGHPHLPEPPETVIVRLPAPEPVYVEPMERKPQSATVKVVPQLPRPTPRQLKAVAALFANPIDLSEPRHVEAAARGRAIHEQAVSLASEEGITYAEAIRRVLDERA